MELEFTVRSLGLIPDRQGLALGVARSRLLPVFAPCLSFHNSQWRRTRTCAGLISVRRKILCAVYLQSG